MKQNKFMRVILAFSLTILFTCLGCETNEVAQTKNELKKIVIAYAPNESTEESADARFGLAKDLKKELGIEVKEIQASDYNAIVEALRTGQADVAYMGALAVALAANRAGAIPIAMKAPDRDKTKSVYHSLLITNSKNEQISSIKDIKGKTIAFVDPASTSGNLFPTFEIMKNFPGTSNEKLHTNGDFFEAVSYSGKHQAGLQAVIKGDVDIVPISDQILASEFANGNADEKAVKIIHSSAAIPAEALVVSKFMSDEWRNKLQNFFITYDNEEYFAKVIKVPNARFAKASLEDYQIVVDLNKTMN